MGVDVTVCHAVDRVRSVTTIPGAVPLAQPEPEVEIAVVHGFTPRLKVEPPGGQAWQFRRRSPVAADSAGDERVDDELAVDQFTEEADALVGPGDPLGRF